MKTVIKEIIVQALPSPQWGADGEAVVVWQINLDQGQDAATVEIVILEVSATWRAYTDEDCENAVSGAVKCSGDAWKFNVDAFGLENLALDFPKASGAELALRPEEVVIDLRNKVVTVRFQF